MTPGRRRLLEAGYLPTAVKEAVLPGIIGGGGGGGGGYGRALFGRGPSGEAGDTRSGISSGASWGRGGRVGELGVVPGRWPSSFLKEECPVIEDAP